MSSNFFGDNLNTAQNGADSPLSPAGSGPLPIRSSALSNKITTVLSSSYADSDIRDALSILDARDVHNNADTRRKLRLDAQQEVIECNREVVEDFGKVAEVCCWNQKLAIRTPAYRMGTAVETYWHDDCDP